MGDYSGTGFTYRELRDDWACDYCGAVVKKLGPHMWKHNQKHLAAGDVIVSSIKKPNEKGEEMDQPKIAQNLSMKVIERMLEPKELADFIEKYNSSKNGPGGGWNRAFALSIPVSADEMELVNFYCFRTDDNLRDYSKEKGTVPSNIYNKVKLIALRLIHQHPEIFNK